MFKFNKNYIFSLYTEYFLYEPANVFNKYILETARTNSLNFYNIRSSTNEVFKQKKLTSLMYMPTLRTTHCNCLNKKVVCCYL